MLRVVIIEDTPEEAATLRGHLERYAAEKGFSLSVTWLTNALDFLEDQPKADLVFMDIDMPGIDGLEAAHQLREYDATTPLVFVTNLAQYAVRGDEVRLSDGSTLYMSRAHKREAQAAIAAYLGGSL